MNCTEREQIGFIFMRKNYPSVTPRRMKGLLFLRHVRFDYFPFSNGKFKQMT